MIGDAMRSTYAPKACITDEVCITHAVRITFRKEHITQKSLFCLVDKRDFFVGDPYGTRTYGLDWQTYCNFNIFDSSVHNFIHNF